MHLYFTSFLYASPIQHIQRSDTAKAARGLASNMKTRGAYCMKKTKAVRIASLISGISILFSMASVYAAEAEESGTQYEDTIEGETAHGSTETVELETENSNGNQISAPEESEIQLENSTTEPEESQSQFENSTTGPEESQSPSEDASETESELESLQEEESGAQSEPDTEERAEEMTEITDESGQIEKRWKAGMGLTSLLMPQKFEIVLDPWEMDGRTQIYSEQYIIKNTGDMLGTLKLTGIACETGEDVHVQKSSDGIHNGKDKKLYIELLVNDEERLVLMPEGTDYEIELAPDESITLEFTGEMNENTPQNWQNSDVRISVTYDWCAETMESISEPTEEDSECSESESVTEGEGSEAESEIKPEEENSEDISEPVQESSEAETETSEESTASEAESEEKNSESVSESAGESSASESKTAEESSEAAETAQPEGNHTQENSDIEATGNPESGEETGNE
jgi:hypothetical protein